jgi:hypothetical protein
VAESMGPLVHEHLSKLLVIEAFGETRRNQESRPELAERQGNAHA